VLVTNIAVKVGKEAQVHVVSTMKVVVTIFVVLMARVFVASTMDPIPIGPFE
jgi:hypothetical protein